jgi:hypothetical protein
MEECWKLGQHPPKGATARELTEGRSTGKEETPLSP